MKQINLTNSRRRLWAAAVCGLLAAFAPACAQQTPPGSMAQTSAAVPAPLAGVRRIVCLGDSITQGGEGPGGYVWLTRHYLAALYPQQNITVINAGISGHKSNDMLARFGRDVLDRSPDLVTISVGVNDVWHAFRDFANRRDYPNGDLPNGVPLDAFRHNVEEMVRRAQAAHARVVVLSPTLIYENLDSPENARLTRYSDALRDIARRHGCLFVDYQKPFKTLVRDYRRLTGASDNLLTGDGVHMNAAGNRIMAHTLLTALGVTPEAQAGAQAQVAQEQQAGRTP